MKKFAIFIFFVALSVLIRPSTSAKSIGNKAILSNDNQAVYLPITFKQDIEHSALMALYDSTNGSNWKSNSGWGTANPYCSWYGVTCASGHVTVLSLTSNHLSGPIPPELGNLSSLERLSFFENQLSGAIPAELGNLSSLQSLFLPNNQLSGAIPAELGSLSSLLYFSLPNNQLSGAIPAELGNLSRLKSMWIYANYLSGAIPAELGNLNSLQTLNLGANQLSGPIPDQLRNMSRLRRLHLHQNPLKCWETYEARNWAMGLDYLGPSSVCPK